jgi:exodeoxyribonuclease VII large subunit
VGHEVDVTLTDLAADARASTPSQAAELLVPDALAQREKLSQARTRLLRAMGARVTEDRATLYALRASFGGFRRALADHEQRVDDLAQRLSQAASRAEARRRAEFERWHRRLLARHPRAVIAVSRAELSPLAVRLRGAERAIVETARGRLSQRLARLHALSPLSVLARGYAIVKAEDGRAVRSAAEVVAGDKLSVRVHRGAFSARVLGLLVTTDVFREEPS